MKQNNKSFKRKTQSDKSLTPNNNITKNFPNINSKVSNSRKDSLTPNLSKTNKNNSYKFKEISKLIVNKADNILKINTKFQSKVEDLEIYEESKSQKNSNTFLTDIELMRLEKEKDYLRYNTDLPMPEEDYLKKDFLEFREMLREIESIKNNIKSEYSEIDYLVNYVKDTKSALNQHMKGVKTLYNKAGLKETYTNNIDSEDEDSSVSGDDNEVLFDKEKNISKITNKLFNITNNVIDYHKDFEKGMQKAYSLNSESTINYDDKKIEKLPEIPLIKKN